MAWVSQDKHNNYGWIGGRGHQGGGDSGYHYGYPAYGPSEPNVVAQWLFDEASGDIVDEVNAISVPVLGSPTYGVTEVGLWAGLSPGIRMNGTTQRFRNTSGSAFLNMGTSDFVSEWVASHDNSGQAYEIDWWTGGEDTAEPGVEVYSRFNANSFRISTRAGDGTQVIGSLSTSDQRDATTRKYRLVGDRTANTEELFIDGVSQGTISIAALSGKSLSSNSDIAVGAATFGLMGVIYELRHTIGNKTNNSGGPGGG